MKPCENPVAEQPTALQDLDTPLIHQFIPQSLQTPDHDTSVLRNSPIASRCPERQHPRRALGEAHTQLVLSSEAGKLWHMRGTSVQAHADSCGPFMRACFWAILYLLDPHKYWGASNLANLRCVHMRLILSIPNVSYRTTRTLSALMMLSSPKPTAQCQQLCGLDPVAPSNYSDFAPPAAS